MRKGLLTPFSPCLQSEDQSEDIRKGIWNLLQILLMQTSGLHVAVKIP